MDSPRPPLIRFAAGITTFFLVFIVIYAILAILLSFTVGLGTAGDLTAVGLAAAACLLLWRIPPWGSSPFKRAGSGTAAVICCVVALAACAVRWPAVGLALGAVVLTGLASAVLEELVCRWAPAALLKRSGREDLPAKVTAGAISTVVFVLLHQNTDPWLLADKAIFGAVAFYLVVLTGHVLLPILLHLASNLLLETALQAGLVTESAALMTLDCLLMGAVVAAMSIHARQQAHLSRMAKNNEYSN